MRFQVRLSAPPLSARVSREVVASTLARLVASDSKMSKAELGRLTGLSRTTIDSGVRTLLDLGAIKVEGVLSTPGRGRPPEVLLLNPQFGVVLVADCGATHASLGVFDLGQRLLAQEDIDLRIEDAPEPILEGMAARFRRMLEELGIADVSRSLVMGLPAPVDQRGGTVVRPPIMPAWDGYPVVEGMGELIGGRVLLENDVNLRALGEARSLSPARGPLLYVKVGTGVGVGTVAPDGNLVRGADGAAGDIGHVRVGGSDAVCSCGNIGCLEAVASMHAVAGALGLDGHTLEGRARVISLIREHDPQAIRLVKDAAEHIGEVVVSLIHFLNPERVVIGGQLAAASDHMLAVIRSIVYSRALPLATRNLTLERPVLGARSGLAGGLTLGLEADLDPEAVGDRMQKFEERQRRIRIG